MSHWAAAFTKTMLNCMFFCLLFTKWFLNKTFSMNNILLSFLHRSKHGHESPGRVSLSNITDCKRLPRVHLISCQGVTFPFFYFWGSTLLWGFPSLGHLLPSAATGRYRPSQVLEDGGWQLNGVKLPRVNSLTCQIGFAFCSVVHVS